MPARIVGAIGRDVQFAQDFTVAVSSASRGLSLPRASALPAEAQKRPKQQGRSSRDQDDVERDAESRGAEDPIEQTDGGENQGPRAGPEAVEEKREADHQR